MGMRDDMMKPKKQNLEEDSNRGSTNLGRLFIHLQRLEKSPRTFGEVGPLTPSEIHTIDAIGLGEGILMSELAGRLCVTKGAVTQIVKRLEAKEFVKRSPHPSDSRSILIALKEKGRIAYQVHKEEHLNFYQQLRAQLGQHEIEVFETVIEKLNDSLGAEERKKPRA